MKRFWKYACEYAMLEPNDNLIQEPVRFGPIILKPGDRIAYMGDGRPHRSFEMAEGFSLQYTGYVLLEENAQFLLFTVPEQPEFKMHGIYYSFLFLEPPYTLCLYNGIGSRVIYLKNVISAQHEPKAKRHVQLTIFNLMGVT